MTDADHNQSSRETHDAHPPSPLADSAKPADSRTYLYGAVAIAIGILTGVAIGAISLHQPKATPPPTPLAGQQPGLSRALNDLGLATSSSQGLKGHLTTQWTEKAVYHVTIEPADATMRSGFALSVSDPPRPLSVNIQLKDRLGFVMCSREVLLKYQARKPADLEVTAPYSTSGKKPRLKKISAKEGKRRKAEQADFDRKQARELAREHGKDVFQNQLGPDGQIVSISAQGDVPCSQESYERVEGWGFVPDFPTLHEQDRLFSLQPGTRQTAQQTVQTARRRAAYKSPSKTFSFSLEGDDAVVDFDTSEGVLQTQAGKTFVIDKTSGEGNTAVWQAYPAYFHYRCEQTTSSCTLARAGAAVLHARLKR
jgi:hypothetical protein